MYNFKGLEPADKSSGTIELDLLKQVSKSNIEILSKTSTKTSKGMLSKGWYKIDDEVFLVKGNTEGNAEPFGEYMGSAIANYMVKDCAIVYYLTPARLFPEIKTYDCSFVSICKKWENENTLSFCNYVNADLGVKETDYFKWLLEKANTNIKYRTALLLFIDAVIGNQDRHLNNWDIDLETGELTKFIDFGASCKGWYWNSHINGIHPDKAKPFAKTHMLQLELLPKLLGNMKLEVRNPREFLSSYIFNNFEYVTEYIAKRIDVIFSEYRYIIKEV